MKIMCVLGSPRRKGNTATVLGWIGDELRIAGHRIEKVFIGDGWVQPCTACQACKTRLDEPGCSIDDGANAVFARLLKCDAVILAAPLYCWGIAAQLKAFIDRCYCMMKDDPKAKDGYRFLFEGKPFALVVTAGGEMKGNLELVKGPFQAFIRFSRCPSGGMLLLPYCASPDKLGRKVRQRARQFAKQLARKLKTV